MKNKNFILILFISIIIMIFGILITIFNISKSNNMVKINAKVHQITNSDNYQVLYLDFIYKDNEYNTVINTNKKDLEVHYLDIYCNKNKISECSLEKKSNNGYLTILVGVILCIIDFLIFRKN